MTRNRWFLGHLMPPLKLYRLQTVKWDVITMNGELVWTWMEETATSFIATFCHSPKANTLWCYAYCIHVHFNLFCHILLTFLFQQFVLWTSGWSNHTFTTILCAGLSGTVPQSGYLHALLLAVTLMRHLWFGHMDWKQHPGYHGDSTQTATFPQQWYS